MVNETDAETIDTRETMNNQAMKLECIARHIASQDASSDSGRDLSRVRATNDTSCGSSNAVARTKRSRNAEWPGEEYEGQYEGQLSCAARTRAHALDMLPDEILAEILLLVVDSLETKVSLAMVCKRFRNILMSFRKLWEEYTLANWRTPEQIAAIAEGHGFTSLEAYIYWGADGDRLNASSKLIMSLRSSIVELELDFSDLHEQWKEEMGQSLKKSGWPKLHTLKVFKSGSDLFLREFSTEFTLLKGVDMPNLQNIVTHINPGVSLGRRLLRCNIILTNVFLDFPELITFLSSPEALQELEITAKHVRCAPGYIHDSINTVDMLNLESLSISVKDDFSCKFVSLLIEKTNMPALRRLNIDMYEGPGPRSQVVSTVSVGQQLLLPFPQIRELGLRVYDIDAAHLVQILFYVPSDVGIILFRTRFSRGEDRFEHLIKPGAFTNHRLRRIQFMECECLDRKFMANVVEFLRGSGLVGMEMEVLKCENWKDGMYTLDTVCSAYVGG